MSHTIRMKPKLLARVRRMRGQLEAIERALESETPCGDILNQVASVRGAMNGLTAELMEEHLREHVLEPESHAERSAAADEMISILRTYLK
jgi:DNA-binding FrmR family transcriptional regulator